MIDVTVTFAGQAGQGIDTASDLLARTMARTGYHVFAYPDVMSRIRGGHNFTAVRISDRPVFSPAMGFNLLLALDERSVVEHRKDMVDGGVIVAESAGVDEAALTDSLVRVPLSAIAVERGAPKTMANVVGLGAVFALTGHPLTQLLDLLRDRFTAKGERTVKLNLDCCRAGFDYAAREHKGTCPCALPVVPAGRPRSLMTGSQALGLGALASDVRFYAGYPMSPATPVMEYLAARQEPFGLVVEQAEDEIAAINMVVGAAYAGVRAMTATSGGGFSLMVEGLGLAGMAELPIVVVLAQRPGPATGFPTRTEQGELLFAVQASQDEFPRFVFAPGTPEQAFYAINRAFELAARFQVPAIVLTDQLLSDSVCTVPGLNFARVSVSEDFAHEFWQGRAAGTYKRYAQTKDGVSPRLRPGELPQAVRCMGGEHDEDGFQTEDAGVRTAMHDKRMRKLAAMTEVLEPVLSYPGDIDECVVVCFGSTYGAVREAVDILRRGRASIGMLHLSELAPFPSSQVRAKLEHAGRVITVENNSTGQLARLLTRETLVTPHEHVLRYDGRPFKGQELAGQLKAALR